MADSFDRYDDEGQGNGFMMGLLTGAVLGAGIGMLLAPKAGTELRGAIGEQARNLGSMASEQYKKASHTASGWADRGREFVDKARESVQRGVEDARGYAGATTGSNYAGNQGGSFGAGTSGSGNYGTNTGTTGTTGGSFGSTGGGFGGSTGGSDYGRS
jgi:gas vesicle protein